MCRATKQSEYLQVAEHLGYSDMKNNKQTRPKTIRKTTKKNGKLFVIAASLVVLIGACVAIFVSLPNTTNLPNNSATSSSADEVKQEALKLMNSDSKKAKTLLQQALAMYQSSKDTNNIVDTESLIYLIDHKK